MLNRIVLGGLTGQSMGEAERHCWQSSRDADERNPIRAPSYLEQTNTTLIELGMDLSRTQGQVKSVYLKKWLAQRRGVAQ